VHKPIGEWPIQKVTRNTILEKCGLRKLWMQKNVSARTLLSHLVRMFDLATFNGYFRGENPAAWKKGLEHILPPHRHVHREKHHKAIPYQQIGRRLQDLRAFRWPLHYHATPELGMRPTMTLVIEFVALTAARGHEVLLATWEEFDSGRKIWTVPSAHLKMGYLEGKSLERPITKSMLAVLEEMGKRRRDQAPDALVFPGPRSGQVMHSSSIPQFISNSLKWDIEFDAHGFRTALRNWCRVNRFPSEWWDIQVHHKIGNRSSQAYGDDPLIEQRRGMMELWDEYCSKPAPDDKDNGEVIELADKRGLPQHARHRSA
jgi:integrase